MVGNGGIGGGVISSDMSTELNELTFTISLRQLSDLLLSTFATIASLSFVCKEGIYVKKKNGLGDTR